MKIAVIGDTHKDFHKFQETVMYAKQKLDASVLIQVGDFGLTGDFTYYLEQVESFLNIVKMKLYFIDGNHDNIDWLQSKAMRSGLSATKISNHIYYMPRGSQLNIDGKQFFFCGGGFSANYKKLTPDVTYWSGETLTQEDLTRVKDAYHTQVKPCDYFISHDTIPVFNQLISIIPAWFVKWKWPTDYNHRQYLKEMFELSGAKTIIHGHYHSPLQLTDDSVINISLGSEKSSVKDRCYLIDTKKPTRKLSDKFTKI